MGGFCFAPEDGARFGSEGGGIGPGGAIHVASAQAQGEGGLARARFTGENGEHAGGEPGGPVPGEGGDEVIHVLPGGGGGRGQASLLRGEGGVAGSSEGLFEEGIAGGKEVEAREDFGSSGRHREIIALMFYLYKRSVKWVSILFTFQRIVCII